jgi:hypothetical protein
MELNRNSRVMPALVAGIHAFLQQGKLCKQCVDVRDKPGPAMTLKR